VRLEMVAGVMSQSERLLQEAQGHPIDEAAILTKVADRACAACPGHKGCKVAEQIANLPATLLHQQQIHMDDVPVDCKKRSRLLQELRRGQDQFRILQADRQRQQEYRSAVIQQYHFLSEYLQEQADRLPQRGNTRPQRFQPEVAVCSAGKESANGDRCLWFAGTEHRYYLLLCDGMGTGAGAAEEARIAGNMLRRLLVAGFPARYALRSINSILVLRGQAGAVTVDLAEIRLDSGKVTVYKWGAAPSWLLRRGSSEKIGTATPPPGISLTESRETVSRLSLRRGETLILLSDGVDGEEVLRRGVFAPDAPPGELAARILERGCGRKEDDATAVVIRLRPRQPGIS
jgi:hypothetical protein